MSGDLFDIIKSVVDELSSELFEKSPTVCWCGSPDHQPRSCEKLFEKADLALDCIAKACAAPSLAEVQLGGGSGSIWVDIESSAFGITMRREFYRLEDETLVVHRHLDVVDRQRGIGSRLLGRAVEGYRGLGVASIQLTAARGDDLVGYYVWPRLGFTLPISQELQERAELERGFVDIPNTLELFSQYERDGALDWWLTNGEGGEAFFDLRESSDNCDWLADYLVEAEIQVS